MAISERYDALVVGAGILGLAHAYHLARAGLKVGVFERGARATGASIRNFGMIWPIGQPPGELRKIALRSRDLWVDILGAAGIWHERCGSLHLAYADDEMAVLEEFVAKGPDLGYDVELITAEEVLSRSPVVRPGALLGGLWSDKEVCVFPRQVVAKLPTYLESLGAVFRWECAVTQVESGRILAGGREFASDRIYLCPGDDFETLVPTLFAELGMTRVKLQMLRARPRRTDYRIGPHLCAGLTLGHYANFRICDRLPELLARHASAWPEQVRWGIHLLVSQHEDGQLTIGDSHEYGLAVTPFLRQDIDAWILDYLDTFLDVSELEITERWHGVYAKHPRRAYVAETVAPGVHLATGVGGAGMTLSFGLAERLVSGHFGMR